MTVTVPHTRSTPADVFRYEEDGLYELVDGQLVKKTVSALTSEATGTITGHLFAFLHPARVGKIYPEQSFQCFPHDADLVRRPDIAVILSYRAAAVEEEGHVTIAPDLAIEVVSPTDRVYELDEKLADYRSAGVKLVWVVNPKARVIRVYPAGQSSFDLREEDVVTGGSVMPGFSVPLRDLLPPKVVTP